MSIARPKIGLIVGSTRPVRVGGPVAEHLLPLIEAAGAEPVLLDLAEVDLPLLNEALPPGSGIRNEPHTIAWGESIAELDGVIFLTPEYNHGYPAALKNAVDTILAEWKGLPGALISYGWSGGHLAAGQLRPVLEFVGIQFSSENVLMPFNPEDFDDAARIVDPANFVARHGEEIEAALEALVEASSVSVEDRETVAVEAA